MTQRFSRIRAILLLVVAIYAPGLRLTAAEPVAVVSVSGLGEALSDVEYLLEATGTDGFGQFFMPQVKAYLQGLSTDRPIGLVVSAEGQSFQPLAFLPVDDLESFLSQMEDTLGEPADAGDGILELQGPQPIFVKEQGAWAFIGQKIEALDDLPGNPEELLKGLNKKYDVAIRGYVQNIPEQYREMIVAQLRQGLEQGLEDADDPNARKMAEAQVEQITRMFTEGDELTFGWNVDPKSKETFFEGTVTAKPGTKLAKDMASGADVTTKYSGFIVSDAAISGNISSIVVEDQIDQMVAAFDGLEKSALKEIDEDADIDDETIRKSARKMVEGVFSILKDTMKTGKLDTASSVVLDDKSITIATAAHVADGKAVEELISELVGLAKESEEVSFSKLNMNAGSYNDIKLIEMAIPIPEDEYVSEVLGGELEVCVGIAQNDVFIVVGSNPVSNLKKMVDACRAAGEVKVSPFNATVKLSPILKFAEAVEENVQVGGIVAMLEESGSDHIKINAELIENGAAYRFTIEEGVLKAIGQAIQMNMAGQGF